MHSLANDRWHVFQILVGVNDIAHRERDGGDLRRVRRKGKCTRMMHMYAAKAG